jgi:hypothetical protein
MAMKTDPFSMVQRATKKAFQQVGQVAQVESDPDLKLYSTLKPEHFQELMRVYGEGPIIDYIKEMESKKIMRGGK